jgi:hypothetical protein
MVLLVPVTPEASPLRGPLNRYAIRTRRLDSFPGGHGLGTVGEHGARSVAHEALGDRAEKQALEATRPARTDDEKIGTDVLRELRDFEVRASDPGVQDDARNGGTHLLRETLEPDVVGIRFARALERTIRGQNRRAPARSLGRDVNEVKLTPRISGKVCGGLEDLFCERRKIDCDEHDDFVVLVDGLGLHGFLLFEALSLQG